MVAAESETDGGASLGIKLLGDIHDLFEEFTVGFMPSAELVNRLRKVDESPWVERDLTTTMLAKMLLPYGVKPSHNTAKTARGYRKDTFADAFTRYLPSVPVRSSARNCDQHEQADGYEPTDGSTRPVESTRPAVLAGKHARADDRTGTDGQTGRFDPDMWPDG